MKPSRKPLPQTVSTTVLIPLLAPVSLRGRSPTALLRLTHNHHIDARLDGFHAGARRDVWLCSAESLFVEDWTPESVQQTVSSARRELAAQRPSRRLGVLLVWNGHRALRDFLLHALTGAQADMSAQTAMQCLQTLRSPGSVHQLSTLASQLWRQGSNGRPQGIDPHISALILSGLKLIGVVSEAPRPSLLFLEAEPADCPRPASSHWQHCAA